MAELLRPAPTAATRFVGVIGDPISMSRSPLIHNAALASLGLDISYGAYLVRAGEVADAIAGARALGMLGLSVTMPHKAAAADAADQRSPEVDVLGAANTIVFRAGASVAYNTDGIGFIEDLRSTGTIEIPGARAAIIGAGGAARAVLYALADAGASEIVVINRDGARAADTAALAPVARVGPIDDLEGVQLVVHATPLGMAPGPASDEVASAIATLTAPMHTDQVVVDLITSASTTPFMAAAAAHGAVVRNGLGMLVHQAAHQFLLFTGVEAPLDAMWAAVAPQS